MTAELAARFLEADAAAIVLLGVWLAITRSLDTATWLLAIQSLLLGLAAVSIGTSRGSSELVVGGLIAIGIRAVALPWCRCRRRAPRRRFSRSSVPIRQRLSAETMAAPSASTTMLASSGPRCISPRWKVNSVPIRAAGVVISGAASIASAGSF